MFNGIQFFYSFVYGHPNPALRHHTWEKLMRLSSSRRHEPWFALGDFNEIRGNYEKSGGRVRPEASFQDFKQMMRVCKFEDLATVGNRFSWVGQRGTHQVQCCLDRTMATPAWFDLFPVSETEFLEIGESDHRPLVTYISAEREKVTKMFSFDSRMVNKEGFSASVKRGWQGTGQAQLLQIPLSQRLSRCHQQISIWKRHNRNNAEERITMLRGQLDKAVTSTAISQERRNEIIEELNKAYLDEEIYWKQKSRVNWLRSGDRNTKYFHAITKGKRVRNTISSIQYDNGVIYRGQRDIANVAIDYFKKLYTTENIDSRLYEKVFHGFSHCVGPEMNGDLIRQVTEEEIKTTVMDIGAHKAPGPDGFTAIFCHTYWEDIGPEIKKEVVDFFERGTIDSHLNHTNICLIPKVYPPTGMSEFRPIALCNVSYKIISKILVNRLKKCYIRESERLHTWEDDFR